MASASLKTFISTFKDLDADAADKLHARSFSTESFVKAATREKLEAVLGDGPGGYLYTKLHGEHGTNDRVVQDLQILKTMLEPLLEGVQVLLSERKSARVQHTFKASSVGTTDVKKALAAMHIEYKPTTMPCCCDPSDVPPLLDVREYEWQEPYLEIAEVEKSRQYMQDVLCADLPDVIVYTAESVAWLEFYDAKHGVKVTSSKTDLVFLLQTDVSKVIVEAHIAHQQNTRNTRASAKRITNGEVLHSLRPYMVAAFELKTPTAMDTPSQCYAQAAAEALCLRSIQQGVIGDVPVIVGDLIKNAVVHTAQVGETTEFHVAVPQMEGEQGRKQAVSYIRAMLKATRDARASALSGGDSGDSGGSGDSGTGSSAADRQGEHRRPGDLGPDIAAPFAALQLQSSSGGVQPGPCDESMGAQSPEGCPASESLYEFDEDMMDAENKFHRQLYELFQIPAIYEAYGLSGPPSQIVHKSLCEIMRHKRLHV